MARSYDKLWKLLIDKKMMKTELREAAGISTNALAKLGKNESVQLQTLEKILSTLVKNLGYTIVLVLAIILFAIFSDGLILSAFNLVIKS